MNEQVMTMLKKQRSSQNHVNSFENLDDMELLALIAQQRDHQAFEEYIKRHQKSAYSVAKLILQDTSLAEDALQESMLLVWRSADTFQAPGNPTAWTLKIVERVCLRLRQRKASHISLKNKTKHEPAPPRSTNSNESERQEILTALGPMFSQLPLVERRILGLRFAANLSQQEVAQALDLPQTTVSFKIRKTLEELRTKLASLGFASAIATTDHETISLAITNWATIPPDALTRIMNNISIEANPSIPELSAKESTPILYFGIGIIVIASIATYASLRQRPSNSTTPTTTTTVLKSTTPQIQTNRKYFYKKWNFNTYNKDVTSGIRIGSTHDTRLRFSKSGIDGTGCVELLNPILLYFEVPAEALPVVIRFQSCPVKGTCHSHAGWLPHEGFTWVGGGHKNSSGYIPGKSWFKHNYYVFDEHVDIWSRGSRRGVGFYRKPKVSVFTLALWGHQRIDNLEIQSLKSGEYPDTTSYDTIFEDPITTPWRHQLQLASGTFPISDKRPAVLPYEYYPPSNAFFVTPKNYKSTLNTESQPKQ